MMAKSRFYGEQKKVTVKLLTFEALNVRVLRMECHFAVINFTLILRASLALIEVQNFCCSLFS